MKSTFHAGAIAAVLAVSGWSTVTHDFAIAEGLIVQSAHASGGNHAASSGCNLCGCTTNHYADCVIGGVDFLRCYLHPNEICYPS